ncbi:hypothetical protein D9757_009204 [Collybiopsis confluens]|uniref:Uncharacterized protein n=1 Tax=Collybiopsis confluens TaxID=2823264 RepID=A0A8H5HAE3_9AGAR|nr:hypothetical protein D9757_009204 [Collybiopsis confluens]
MPSLEPILIGTVFAIAFMLSMRFNPRRTDDTSHALWVLVLHDLCGRHFGRLVPTPQYRIYWSVRDSLHFQDQDPDVTMPDSEILEVIPDFAILLFRGVLSSTTVRKTFMEVLSKFRPTSYFHNNLRVTACFIPLLVELKRPVSRHCSDIDQFMDGLSKLMGNARMQVQSQVYMPSSSSVNHNSDTYSTKAECLFSTPKFYRQSEVIVIAAVGDWWCFRVSKRSHFIVGDGFKFFNYPEEVEIEWEKEEVSDQLLAPAETQQMQLVMKNEESKQDRIKRLNKERDERANQRQKRKEKQQEVYQEWCDFIGSLGNDTSFTVRQMNKYSRLRWNWDDEWRLRVPQQDNFIQPDLPRDRINLHDYHDRPSGLMKLGSGRSRRHLDCIRMFLGPSDCPWLGG